MFLENEKKPVNYYNGCFLKFGVEVGVEELIVKASPGYKPDQLFKSHVLRFLICSLKNKSFLKGVVDQLFKSDLTFWVVCVFNLQFEKSVFLRRAVHSELTLQRKLRRHLLIIF
jgi:hypothetical protein